MAVQLPPAESLLVDPDACDQLAGANQILFGEHPFAYLRTEYGPLTFYASAAGQWLTGRRLLGEMLLVTAGYAAGYAILFALLRSVSSRLSVSLATLAVALSVMPKAYKYYIVLGPVSALWMAWRYLEIPERRRLWSLALAIAAAGLFRADFGVYTALAGGFAVALAERDGGRRLARLVELAIAIALCASPWLLWALGHGALQEYLLDQTVGALGSATGLARPWPRPHPELPLGDIENLRFALFAAFHALPAVSLLALLLRPDPWGDLTRRRVAVAAVLAELTLVQGIHRAGYAHFLQSIPICFVLIAWLTSEALSGVAVAAAPIRRRLAAGSALCLLAAIVVALLSLTVRIRGAIGLEQVVGLPEKVRAYALPRDSLLDTVERRGHELWQLRAIRLARACTAPTQRLVAYPLLSNLNYFADRPLGGGRLGLVAGYFSTMDDQKRIVERLSSEDVGLVVVLPAFSLDRREGGRLEEFAPLVDGYLRERFRVVARVGPADLMAPVGAATACYDDRRAAGSESSPGERPNSTAGERSASSESQP